MTNLSPKAKDLLQAAHQTFSPTDERVAAVRRALEARLADVGDDEHLGNTDGEDEASGAGKLGAPWWNGPRMLGVGVILAIFAAGAFVIGVRLHASAARELSHGVASQVAIPAALPSSATPQLEAAGPDPLPPMAAQISRGRDEPRVSGEHAASAPAGAHELARDQPQPAQARALAHKRESAGVPVVRQPPSAARTPSPSAATAMTSSTPSSRAGHDARKARAPTATQELADARNARDVADAREVPASHQAQPVASVASVAPVARSAADADLGDRVAAARSAATPVARAAVSQSAAPGDDSLAREVALLRRARAALAQHDAHSALALSDEHQQLFPNGRLRQERMAVRVLSLCTLGRSIEAQTVTQELERIAPRSPHLMRIRQACPAQGTSQTSP